MPKPGVLPFGIAPCIRLPDRHRLGHRYLVPQRADQPRHAMGAHRRQRGIKPAQHQGFHLLTRAIRHHRVKPRVNPLPQSLPIRFQKHRDAVGTVQNRPAPLVMKRRQWFACRHKHLQSPQIALRVTRPQPLGCNRVNRFKPRVHLLCGPALRPSAQLGPHGFWHGRNIG